MSEIKHIAENIEDQILSHMMRAGTKSSFELKNASMIVLRGQRHGRRYNVPGSGRVTYNKRNKTARVSYRQYTASAPGEPPAVRTGAFRLGWMPQTKITDGGRTVTSLIRNGQKVNNGDLLGDILENGTGRMAPRPYKEKVLSKALPKIKRYYQNL
ncbi:MAG: hypothetical protein IIV02_06065 [Peptococcaceae bacterium]|nr:hypothetical protein [Peptococcaceae bacterium]